MSEEPAATETITLKRRHHYRVGDRLISGRLLYRVVEVVDDTTIRVVRQQGVSERR